MVRKHGLIVLGLAGAMGFLVGCAASPEEVKQAEMSKMDPCNLSVLVAKGMAPKWVNQKGAAFSGEQRVFYGVGNVSGVANSALKRRSAEAAARGDISKEMSSFLQVMNKQYLAGTTAGSQDRKSEEQHIEDVQKQLSEATLNGASIVEIWEHPCVDRNEIYALARMDMARFQDMVAGLQANDAKFKELDAKLKETIKQNADKVHGEMAKEFEKQNAR